MRGMDGARVNGKAWPGVASTIPLVAAQPGPRLLALGGGDRGSYLKGVGKGGAVKLGKGHESEDKHVIEEHDVSTSIISC